MDFDYSRWRAVLRDGEWIVINEARQEAPEPSRFTEPTPAQKRADRLNRDEQYKLIGVKAPEEM